MSDEIANFIKSSRGREKSSIPSKGELRNKILPFGLNAIIAKVYKDKSWIDKKSASSSITPRLHWSRIGSAMRFAKLAPRTYLG